MEGCEDGRKDVWKEEGCVHKKKEIFVDEKEDVVMVGEMCGWERRCVKGWKGV